MWLYFIGNDKEKLNVYGVDSTSLDDWNMNVTQRAYAIVQQYINVCLIIFIIVIYYIL